MSNTDDNVVTNYTSFSYSVCQTGYPADQMIFTFVALAYAVILFTLNSCVLGIITRQVVSEGTVRSGDILVLNWAAIELFISGSYALYILTSYVCNETLQAIASCTSYLTYFGRPWSQAFLCIERYLAMAHPLTYMSTNVRRSKFMFVVFIWLFSLPMGLLCYFTLYQYYLYLFPVAVTFVIISFCCYSILKILSKPKPGHGDVNVMDQFKKKSFRIILFCLALAIVGYAPFFFLSVLPVPIYVLCVYNWVMPLLLMPSVLLEPVLYLSKTGKLRWMKRWARGLITDLLSM